MNKRIIVILIFSMTVLLGQSMDSTVYKKPKTAFFYSLVPGCGQLYNGKWVKAMMFVFLELAATKAWMENSESYNNYDQGSYTMKKHRYLEKRNKYAWWMGFLYFFGMLDAVVDAHLQPFDEIMDSNIESKQEKRSQDGD